MSGRCSMVSVRMCAPRSRANRAGTASSKNSHRCAPLPERDRSMAAHSPNRRHVSATAATSSRQVVRSKSAARKKQDSSTNMG